MALDLKKMKAKRDALENRGGKNDFWRPEDGATTIRLLPTADGDPFKEYWFHYNLGKNPGFLSPKKNFGEDCPLDSFVRQLYKDGSDESIKMAKNLSARQRFCSPVLVRGEEDQGVRLWGYGKMAYETLLGYVIDPDYGDITSSETGTDIVLTYTVPGTPGSFPKTQLKPRRRPSVLCDDAIADCDALIDSVPDIEAQFNRLSSEEIQAILDDYLSTDSSSEMSSSETAKYGSSVDKKLNDFLS